MDNDLKTNDCFLKILEESKKIIEVPFFYPDFLMVNSSINQNLNDKHFGCWFIQSLCHVIRTYNQTEDLLTMLTRISSQVERIPGNNIPPMISMTLSQLIFFPEPIKVEIK